jgi:hypothetical protein
MKWLTSPQNPAVRYLMDPDPSRKRAILRWGPMKKILALQKEDGSFISPVGTFRALTYMHRCGLDAGDEPVARALEYVTDRHIGKGAFSLNTGGSGILPCYVGMFTRPIIEMAGHRHPGAKASIQWLVDHQRFDHRKTRGGGRKTWPFRAVASYGCWQSVSCYHGVVGALRAMAAVPPRSRSKDLRSRLKEALQYLEIHRVWKKSSDDKPLFRHMTRFFLHGGYRFHLIDVLEGMADADPKMIRKPWVQEAVDTVDALTVDGKVPLVMNYPNEIIDPLPLEAVGKPSRFLTYQWLQVKKRFGI